MRIAISEIKHSEKPISGGATTNTLQVKDVSLYDLVHYIENGCGFSNPFHNKKGKDNCDPTNLIIIDIDKVDFNMDYIRKFIKGIIYYPSFSDGLNNKHSYRVIVKVDKFINTRDEYKFYANSLISMLNEYGIDVDECCNQMDRLYYGTKYKCIVNDVEYNYTLEELGKMSKSSITDHNNVVTIKCSSHSNKCLKSKEDALISDCNTDFIKDFMRGYNYGLLIEKYGYRFSIIDKPKIDWGEDELYREISDYIEIVNRWRNKRIVKYDIGENRKSKEYMRLCIKKYIKPDITFPELLMNSIFDINNYFINTDNKLNKEWVYGTVKKVFETDVDEFEFATKNKIKVNTKLAEEKGISCQKITGGVRRKKNEEKVIKDFDSSLNLKNNYERFIQQGNKLSYDCYKNICRSLNLDYKGKHK